MKLDKSLLRTVLFALGVVAFIIGVYQTLYYNDLGRNYWIFHGVADLLDAARVLAAAGGASGEGSGCRSQAGPGKPPQARRGEA